MQEDILPTTKKIVERAKSVSINEHAVHQFCDSFSPDNALTTELGLTAENAVVIGSGILNALNLRESKDVDVIVTKEKYKELSDNSRFRKKQNHGREVLDDDLFEIGTSWTVVGKIWKFDDLLSYSTIIDGVRYNTIEFLLDAKRRWIADGEGRQKDIDDVKLMEQYLSSLKA